MDEHAVIEVTRSWIYQVVIGLNLCPFARRVFQSNLIRYVVSKATSEEALLEELDLELRNLSRVPVTEIETTLLIHPLVLGNFHDFNDFLATGARLLSALRLRGIIQIASFHPDYQFEGTKPGDVENYTNRSPYPMLHLLREDSITRIASDEDELLEIPQRNIKLLKSLGREKMLEMLKDLNHRGTEDTEKKPRETQ
jgi:hypothetical protein